MNFEALMSQIENDPVKVFEVAGLLWDSLFEHLNSDLSLDRVSEVPGFLMAVMGTFEEAGFTREEAYTAVFRLPYPTGASVASSCELDYCLDPEEEEDLLEDEFFQEDEDDFEDWHDEDFDTEDMGDTE